MLSFQCGLQPQEGALDDLEVVAEVFDRLVGAIGDVECCVGKLPLPCPSNYQGSDRHLCHGSRGCTWVVCYKSSMHNPTMLSNHKSKATVCAAGQKMYV